MSQETIDKKINIPITLKKPVPMNEEFDLHYITYLGKLTYIVARFDACQTDDHQVIQMIHQKDQHGNTALDIAAFCGYRNIVLYLLQNGANPLDPNNRGRNAFHKLCYRGEYDALIQAMNLDRHLKRRGLCEALLREKQSKKFKNLDIKQGSLVSTVFHDDETVKRHQIFNINIEDVFEMYIRSCQETLRAWICQADEHRRNPLHYASMSKYTKSNKCIEALLKIDVLHVPDYPQFEQLNQELQLLEQNDERKQDPRRYLGIIEEFRHLLNPAVFNKLMKEFRIGSRQIIRESLNAQDVNGHTPLHIAAYFGNYAMVRLFTKEGADANIRDFLNNANPLDISKDKFCRSVLSNLNDAATKCDERNLKHLVNCGNKIDSKSSIFSQAPIHKVITAPRPDKSSTLETIIDFGADVDAIDSNGWTALHHASHSGDTGMANILIQNKADLNAFSNSKKTPMHFAALANQVESLNLLISAGAHLECFTEDKCTPLHLACKKGNLECVEVLLNSGADLYARDHRQWSALHYATYNGHKDVVNLVLKQDADFEKLRYMENSQGKKAEQISKNPETKQGLKVIWRCAQMGDLDTIRNLHREGQDLNEQTKHFRNTALHIAVVSDQYLIVKYLVENGANVTLANKEGKTPLDYSHQNDENKIFKVLVRGGAKTDDN